MTGDLDAASEPVCREYEHSHTEVSRLEWVRVTSDVGSVDLYVDYCLDCLDCL